MSKNISRWFWYFSAVVVLFLFSALFNLSIILSEIPYIIGMHLIAEAFVLVIVLRILRKLDMLASFKIIAYYTVVVGGSLAIVFLLTLEGNANFLHYALSVFMLFVFLNLGLLEIMFDINFWKACLISIITGLINALMVVITTPVCH